MLLIIFLGLIAKIGLVSGNCDVGTPEMNNYDFLKVCAGVLTRLLKHAPFKTVFDFTFNVLLQ